MYIPNGHITFMDRTRFSCAKPLGMITRETLEDTSCCLCDAVEPNAARDVPYVESQSPNVWGNYFFVCCEYTRLVSSPPNVLCCAEELVLGRFLQPIRSARFDVSTAGVVSLNVPSVRLLLDSNAADALLRSSFGFVIRFVLYEPVLYVAFRGLYRWSCSSETHEAEPEIFWDVSFFFGESSSSKLSVNGTNSPSFVSSYPNFCDELRMDGMRA